MGIGAWCKGKKGQMLVEVLVVMGVGIIIMAAATNLFIDVQKSSIINRQKTKANNLAQEALEAVRSVRYSGWSNIATNGTYHPVVSGGTWQLQAGSETIDEFTREITISSVYRIANPASPDFLKIVSPTTPGAKEDRSTKEITVRISWSTPRNQEVVQKTYLTRYLNNNLVTQTTQADFNAGTNNNTQVVPAPPPPADNGSVILASGTGPPSYYGNRFLLKSVSGIGRLTRSTLRCSMRFTAQASKTVTSIRVYIHERQNPPMYRFGIQADSGGQPSGTWLGYGESAPVGTGWRAVTLTTPATLTAGQVYHLVVQYRGGAIGWNRYINIRRSAPLNLLYPYNNNADTAANTCWYNGASWSTQNYQPIYFLAFSDGTYEGNPYYTSVARAIYRTYCHGERFLVSGGNKTVTQIGFYVARTSGLPADNLYVRLYDVIGGSLIEQGVLATPTGVGTTFSWQTYTFSTPRILLNGRIYRIYLISPGSIASRYYRVYRLYNTSAADYNSINYDGLNSVYCYSTNSGLSFTDYAYYDIGGYRFTVPGTGGYVPSGNFTSSVIDVGQEAAFNTLDFDVQIPADTNLQLQVAVSNNPAGPWNYVGPDGTSASYYTLTSTKAIHLDYILGRYFRYRAYLTTTNPSRTPSLDAVYINYSP